MKKLATTLMYLISISIVVMAQAQPNILLIIADDLGNDAIDGFGIAANNYPSTPTLDELRATGVTYMNTWATPQCAPTRASIMSGKYGANTGVQMVPGNLDLEHESLFNFIKRATDDGYSTALVGKWHISDPVDLDHPIQHGADYFEGTMRGSVPDYYSWDKVVDGAEVPVDEYITSHLTDRAIDWVGDQDKPWLMWLAHVAPHSPLHVPPADLHTFNNPTTDRQQYQAMIEAMDHEIGRLLASLDEETRDNTLVIFVGDNGTPNNVLSGYPNRHGKGSMYEGGLRVPMVISGSGVDRSGEEEYGLTQVNDLYATLFEVASGSTLPGGIYNSYSLQSSFAAANTIARAYVYADYLDDGVEYWAIRKGDYKLIENENGEQEMYRLDENTDEEDNLIGSLTAAEEAILADLAAEAEAIRTGWSCQDLILNGSEEAIDDCDDDCPEVDVLSSENIGCCDQPDEPSVYYEYQEDGQRHVYSNGYPNHDYCYNPNNQPTQSYHYYRLELEPQLAAEPTSILRANNRVARHYGVALNGIFFSPAPATPFIYTDKTTGEFNWDWVFEPTNNQGNEQGQVKLDCASAHTNANGYHYHGEMFEYLETYSPGITSATTLEEVYQVGWASDGFPILYKFGPDATGQIRELMPSYQLRSGTRPGDGISAPCGPYTGKYTVDYEYVAGLGDLDECNGIASEVTIETALGQETFGYYYLVTSDFPQIGRCLSGTPSPDFENGQDPLTGVDMDGDGYLAQFDCDDTNPNINPSAEEIPDNSIDEDCDGIALVTSTHQLADVTVRIYPNPATDYIGVAVSGPLQYTAKLYNISGQLIASVTNARSISVESVPAGAYLLELTDNSTGQRVVERVVVR